MRNDLKRGSRNIIWGLVGQLVTICLGIVIPRLVLVSFGSEVNGLLNSITQIYAYFTIFEAGIGTATLQSLYAPTANDDREGINRILAATNRYYKRVAKIYFISVILFATTYPLLVDSSLPYSWVFLIICLNGMGSVINFWVQGKYTLFLSSIGKSYVNTNLATVSTILTSVSKIVLLLNGCDVLRLQVVYFAISLLKMSFIYFYIKRNYAWIDLSVEPNYAALDQRHSVLVHQISYLIFANTDVLLITFFLGLKEVSVYSMYLMLFTMLNTVCQQLYSGFAFRLGQIYNTDKERYTRIHDIFEVYYLAIVFAMYTVAFIYVLPFLKLYTSGVNDINYIDVKLAFLFFAMNLISNGRNSSIMVINFAGHFKNTIKQTVLESAINLTASIIFLKLFGIYGVLLGTIAALAYRMVDMIVYANRKLLNRSSWITFRRWLGNSAFAAAGILLCTKLMQRSFSSYSSLLVSAAVTAVVVLTSFLFGNSMLEYRVCKSVFDMVRGWRQARRASGGK